MSAKDKCPTAQVVTTQTINIGNGLSINRTTFACPDSSLREASQAPPPPSKQIPTNVVGKRDSIFAAFEKRNAVECRNPAPECQCGQDCKFSLLFAFALDSPPPSSLQSPYLFERISPLRPSLPMLCSSLRTLWCA